MTPIRHHSPAAARNAQPILQQLQHLLPAQASVLEVASGSGEHAAAFAAAMPAWQWQPSDADTALLPSIDHWCAALPNVRAAQQLDVLAQPWPLAGRFDALFCANMLHIAAWASAIGLMQAAAAWLRPGGQLITYGPYLQAGVVTAPSNLAFDESLRARNPDWGLRRVEAVAALAAQHRLALQSQIAMPANNLMLVFSLRD